MLNKLKDVIKNSNARNSNFRVSSIIVDEQGNEWSGVNVEYIIPTNSICAERNAISTAITEGMEIGKLKEVNIFAISKNEDEDMFTPPCGLCRQAIFEASNGNAKVVLYNSKGETKEFSIKELLPEAFDGSSI